MAGTGGRRRPGHDGAGEVQAGLRVSGGGGQEWLALCGCLAWTVSFGPGALSDAPCTEEQGEVQREAWPHRWSVAEPEPVPFTHLEGHQKAVGAPGVQHWGEGAACCQLSNCQHDSGFRVEGGAEGGLRWAGLGMQSREPKPQPLGALCPRTHLLRPRPTGQAGLPGPEVPGQEPPAHAPAAGAVPPRAGRSPALPDGAQHGGRRGAGRVRGHLPGSRDPRGQFPEAALSLFLWGLWASDPVHLPGLHCPPFLPLPTDAAGNTP